MSCHDCSPGWCGMVLGRLVRSRPQQGRSYGHSCTRPHLLRHAAGRWLTACRLGCAQSCMGSTGLWGRSCRHGGPVWAFSPRVGCSSEICCHWERVALGKRRMAQSHSHSLLGGSGPWPHTWFCFYEVTNPKQPWPQKIPLFSERSNPEKLLASGHVGLLHTCNKMPWPAPLVQSPRDYNKATGG